MSFFKKLFGGGKSSSGSKATEIIESTLDGIFKVGEFDLTHAVTEDPEKITVELQGGDEELLKEKDGQLMDAFQFYVKRVLQHNIPEFKADVVFDAGGYREESSQALIELADKLKEVAIEKNKSVYIRALAPKDRKVIHQHLSNDTRVKSKSIGDGLYKKIKIFPAGLEPRKRQGDRRDSAHASE
ncbi:MAG: protein jag [Bdellovibrionales bacterium]